tara:strand:- start:381 stop:596 length:216 start_codon:yes stop_codon:yes gene_type:complete
VEFRYLVLKNKVTKADITCMRGITALGVNECKKTLENRVEKLQVKIEGEDWADVPTVNLLRQNINPTSEST